MQAETDLVFHLIESEFQKLSLQKQKELLQVLIGKLGFGQIEKVSADSSQTNPTDKQRRMLGLHEGKGSISDDFTDELPDKFWGGRV